MKKAILFAGCIILCSLISAQIPQGFNYQAIARDNFGNLITNTTLPVTVTIQSDSLGGTIYWQELHATVTTNSYGVLNLIVGKGSRQSISTVNSFNEIDWNKSPIFIKMQVYYNSVLTDMGSAKLWSVPYSMTSGNINGPVDKLEVAGKTDLMDEALFEVKNRNGQTVFAVYNEGVRIYVSNETKAVKGGFSVGGFGTDKTESQKYFVVTKDSTRVYLDNNPLTKGKKSGFAVGGYDLTKGSVQDYLDVNPDSVRVYIDNSSGTKTIKGGFAVGGFGTDKAGESSKYLVVSKDSIRMYLDSNPLTKAKKGGFAVGGYDLTKGLANNYMIIDNDSTNFYVRKISPENSSSFNIIGVDMDMTRKSLLTANSDTIKVSGVLNLQNNLIVNGNIDVSGIINPDTTSISDIDGNKYKTVLIGTQLWMAENLKTTRYCNGELIGTTTPANLDITGEINPAYQWPYSGDQNNVDIYGRLYTWYAAVDVRNICPIGWHVPSDDEWTSLTSFLNGENIASGKLKETGLTHWTDPNTGATNESGFTALPGGNRTMNGLFNEMGNLGKWWSFSEYDLDKAWFRGMTYNSTEVSRSSINKGEGNSVRCLQGVGQSTLPIISTLSASSITSTSAVSGGAITYDGGAIITSRGICWSTLTGPTIDNNKTIDGSGTGVFSSPISGLSVLSTYYIRAYAINSAGIAYGNEVSFTTLPNPPVVSTLPATAVGSVSAKLNGSVNANNSAAAVSFEYGLTASYGYTVTAVESPVSGSNSVPVSFVISGLTPGSTYHYRVKSTNTGGTTFGDDLTFTTPSGVSDIDGNVYTTVKIGTQTWMGENLKTLKLNDGSAIPIITDASAWAALSTPGYCYYGNDEGLKSTYGPLYNWFTVGTGKLCPAGWHVPSDEEWNILISYCGGVNVASGRLKEIGTVHWNNPNTGATNESGFTGLGGGLRNETGGFYSFGQYGGHWSTTEISAGWARYINLINSHTIVGVNGAYKKQGTSVRCLKD